MFLTRGPRVFVLILNYRSAGETLRCVASLRRSTERGIHLAVIDNASGEDEIGLLRHRLGPAVPILEVPDNQGYGAGNNVGIRYALDRDADFVWILNPDTEVEPRALQLLLDGLNNFPDVGFIGSLNLFGGSNPPKVQFAGGTIHWSKGALTDSVGLGKPLTSIQQRDPYFVDYAAGTSMLIRRRVFDDVGLIPEQYFMYFEETDYQVRAARLGWRSAIHPQALVWHHQKSTGSLPAPYYIYYYIRGRFIFAHTHTDIPDTEIEQHLSGFIEGWRAKVERHAPEWLDTYQRLVDWAVTDGQSRRTGPRPEVHQINRPTTR